MSDPISTSPTGRADAPFRAPQPLETLTPLPALDGHDGTNRARGGVPQIAATNDLEAVQAWLGEYAEADHTLRAYRKEAERLLGWAVIERGIPLSSLTREDLQAYTAFLANPRPAGRWVGPRRPRTDARWRPFEGPLKAGSRRQALTILNVLFTYLVQAGYLAGNPLALERRRRRRRTSIEPAERSLDQVTWQFLWRFTAELPADNPPASRMRARLRFLLGAGYLLAPRLSDLSEHTMSSFKRIRGRWWWQVVGKGDKPARIPVPNAMLALLEAYRTAFGLAPHPVAGDATPLVLKLSGAGGVCANLIYRELTTHFRAAAAALEPIDAERAAVLRRASPHWLRHTSLSHQADAGVDLRYINLNARHASFDMTRKYLHADDVSWHGAMTQFTPEPAERPKNA